MMIVLVAAAGVVVVEKQCCCWCLFFLFPAREGVGVVNASVTVVDAGAAVVGAGLVSGLHTTPQHPPRAIRSHRLKAPTVPARARVALAETSVSLLP